MVFKSSKKFIQLFLSVFVLLSLQACNEDDIIPDDPSVVLTDTYRVEYTSDMSMIKDGKSTFTIQITDRVTNAAVPALDVSVMPMMSMVSGMMHSTPIEAIIDNGDGTYEVTVYYLMASSMMDGTVMGEWDLKVMIGGMMGEEAHFYPDVMMAMGDTVMAKLRGQMDMIAGMMGMPDEKRYYFIFKNTLTGMTDNHSFSFFLAAREDMMSHPAVYLNTTLNPGTAYSYWVSPIVVEVSTDGTTWVAATGSGDGNWSVTGLAGLTDDVQGEIFVRLNIQGEDKTTDGLASAGANGYGTFTVTPGSSMAM